MTMNTPRKNKLLIASLVLGLLAVVGALLILSAKLRPAAGDAPRSREATLRNGRQIFMCFYARTIPPSREDNAWPSSARFATSTAFFYHLFTNGQIRVDLSCLAAPGVTPCRGLNVSHFKAENNAWCVVADVTDESPGETPFLLSRNVKATSLAGLRGRVRDTLSGGPPFGRKGALVVSADGKALILDGDMEWSSILGAHTFTNLILRP